MAQAAANFALELAELGATRLPFPSEPEHFHFQLIQMKKTM